MELGDIPPEFGWVLVLFEPNLEPTVSEGVLEPSKGQTMSEGVLEPSKVQTVSEGVLDVEAAQSGSEPSPEPSEARAGPAPIFLNRLDDTFINLDRVEDLEETNSDRSDSTIEVVAPKPYEMTKPGKWGPRRRFKTFACRTDLPPVHKPRTRRSGSSSAPSQPAESTTPLPSKPSSIKSSRQSSQHTHKTSKLVSPSTQEP